MCGIFGFALKKTVSMAEVFKVLERLETHQYAEEPRPVGGYGAGVAVFQDGNVIFEKVGKTDDYSPVRRLAEAFCVDRASVLVAHARMPSPEFMATAMFMETAQPYVVQHGAKHAMVSVHNGKVENYRELRAKLDAGHVFESERAELIDSEVIPHVFDEMFNEKRDNGKALDALFSSLQGSNTIALLHIADKDVFINFVHRGKTRGLRIWTNNYGEIVFCSRKEPLTDTFRNLLADGGFIEKVSIGWREEKNLKSYFRIKQ